ncbi:MAG: GIY-YIG nuclease family protein [Spirochaetales bacterium]|nr:GIY-YIG nuclease family protein [Spirochaetales bacterium]
MNRRRKRIKFTERNKVYPPGAPGVYIIWEDEKPLYVGETRDLNQRFKDLKSTYNHTFRRAIGNELFNNKIGFKATSKKKFPIKGETLNGKILTVDYEQKLTAHFEEKFMYSYIKVAFGRIEIQDKLIDWLSQKYTLKN